MRVHVTLPLFLPDWSERKRERERGSERVRERKTKREGEREKDKEGGGRESARKRKRERERIFKGMTGALAPFGFLVMKVWHCFHLSVVFKNIFLFTKSQVFCYKLTSAVL